MIGKIVKNALCFIFFMVTMMLAPTPLVAQTQNAQNLFDQANAVYKNGEYAKAYDLYNQIPNKSSGIHYNLGNCAFKQGKMGYALLHWRRAERNWGYFGREELLENIAIVKAKTTPQPATTDENITILTSLASFFKSIKNSFFSLVHALPIINLQIIFLALWLFLFIYIRYLYRRKHPIIIILLSVCVGFAGSMLAIKYSFSFKNYIVIVRTPAPLMSGPGAQFATLTQLTEAKEAVMLRESGGFYKIRVSNTIGWIDKNVAEKI